MTAWTCQVLNLRSEIHENKSAASPVTVPRRRKEIDRPEVRGGQGGGEGARRKQGAGGVGGRRDRKREGREKQLTFYAHVRLSGGRGGERGEGRVSTLQKGGSDGGVRRGRGKGRCTVACTCALPPYTTRSYGVFLDAVRPGMCARTYTIDRILTGETNSISGRPRPQTTSVSSRLRATP